jgi:hypothetical protein
MQTPSDGGGGITWDGGQPENVGGKQNAAAGLVQALRRLKNRRGV